MDDEILVQLVQRFCNFLNDNPCLILGEVLLARTHRELAQRLLRILRDQVNIISILEVVDEAQVRLRLLAGLKGFELGHGQLFYLLDRALRNPLEDEFLTSLAMLYQLAVADFIVWQVLDDFELVDALFVLLGLQKVVGALHHLLVRQKVQFAVAIRRHDRKSEMSPIFTEDFLGGRVEGADPTAAQVVDDCPVVLVLASLRERYLIVRRLHEVLLVPAVRRHQEHFVCRDRERFAAHI